MALGTPVAGKSMRVSIAAASSADGGVTYTAGTYSPLGRMNSFGHTENSPSTTVGVFEDAAGFDFPGIGASTYDVSGILAAGDTGQELARAAKAAGSFVFLKVLPSGGAAGTDGYTVLCAVGTMGHTAGLDGAQAHTFQFTRKAASTAIGTAFPNLAN